MALSSAQRQYLKGLAHHLKPVVQIGKSGVSDQLIGSVNTALDVHELIKVKFLELKEQKKELTQSVAERTGSEVVGMVGNIATLYREQADPQKRKITLPTKSS